MSTWKNQKQKSWVAKFQYQNRQYKKEGFQTRQKAREWEMQKRNELKNPPSPETIRLTFSQVSTMYLEDCEARFQKNTVRQKAFVCRNFLSFLNDDPGADLINKQVVLDYLNSRRAKKGNCAANRDLKELKALLNWCCRLPD
jgi:hypothetical protein